MPTKSSVIGETVFRVFYPVSKALSLLVDPGNIFLVLALAGLALSWSGFRRSGQTLLVSCILGLLLIAVVPVGPGMLQVLESRFPAWVDDGPVDGIIVLGGAIDPRRYFWRPGSGMSMAVGRVTEAARLATKYKSARIAIAGGNPTRNDDAHSEARAVQELLIASGIDPSRIALELDSRNTCENAYFLKQMAQPKPGERWLLVTSAFHMPRAMGCFRATGFPVIASPVDFRISAKLRTLHLWPDLMGGLRHLGLAMHEFSGLIAYRLAGRTDDWFPAP